MLTDLFNTSFFIVVGGITTLVSLLMLLAHVTSWVLGIGPVLWRLGIGRWTRKIAIAANDGSYSSIEKDLVESGIFRKGNIEQITGKHIDQVGRMSLVLVHYQSFTQREIQRILDRKSPSSGMIIYFPEYFPGKTQIPLDVLSDIQDKQSTIVVNHRGRLINDLFTTLITTSNG